MFESKSKGGMRSMIVLLIFKMENINNYSTILINYLLIQNPSYQIFNHLL